MNPRVLTPVLILVFCTGWLASAAQHRIPAVAAATQSSTSTTLAQDSQNTRDDLKQMKVLLQQMETNLTFVDTTQTPLKHQFQLDIDMWRQLIRDIERRTQN